MGKPGHAGIGGVLNDSSAVVRGMFSANIGIADYNLTELQAILEALEMFVSQDEIRCCQLII